MRSCLLFIGLMLIGICIMGMISLFFLSESSRSDISFSVPEGTIQPPTFTVTPTSTPYPTSTTAPKLTPTTTPTRTSTTTPTRTVTPTVTFGVVSQTSSPGSGNRTSTPTLTPIAISPTLTQELTTAPGPDDTSTPQVISVSSTAISNPTLTPFPDIFIEAEWPSRLRVGASDLVKVSITKGGDYYVVTVETPNHTAVVSSPIPLNTPVYNSGEVEYDAIVIANLVGANFIIEPSGPIEKSLNEPNPVWTWSISPKTNSPDPQPLNITIDVQYRHPGSSATSERTTVWNYPLYVKVYQSLITPGQISVASIISGFLGSGFSIPWIVEQLQKRKSKPKDKKKPKK